MIILGKALWNNRPLVKFLGLCESWSLWIWGHHNSLRKKLNAVISSYVVVVMRTAAHRHSTCLACSLVYIPQFLTVDEHQEIFDKAKDIPWDRTLRRRTAQFGHYFQHTTNTTFCFDENSVRHRFPAWCQMVCDKVHKVRFLISCFLVAGLQPLWGCSPGIQGLDWVIYFDFKLKKRSIASIGFYLGIKDSCERDFWHPSRSFAPSLSMKSVPHSAPGTQMYFESKLSRNALSVIAKWSKQMYRFWVSVWRIQTFCQQIVNCSLFECESVSNFGSLP